MTCTHANSKWKWILNIYDYGYNFYELNGKANSSSSSSSNSSSCNSSGNGGGGGDGSSSTNRKCMTVQNWQCLQIQWQPQSRSIALHCSIQEKNRYPHRTFLSLIIFARWPIRLSVRPVHSLVHFVFEFWFIFFCLIFSHALWIYIPTIILCVSVPKIHYGHYFFSSF